MNDSHLGTPLFFNSILALKKSLNSSDKWSMKSSLLLFLTVGSGLMASMATRAEGVKNLPLVFDPATKKYFIGGTSKFVLKQGEQSGLIDRIEVSMDGGEYRPYGESIEFKDEGKHTLKFRAVNPVNNWSPVQFVEVFVDLTSPTTNAKFSEERYNKDETGTYLGMNSTVTLVAQDNLSGVASVEYSWDGQNFTPYERPIVVDKPGKQTLFYRSNDRVGNVELVQKLEFTADGTAPTSELKLIGQAKPAILNGKQYVSDSVAFQITATDDTSKVKTTFVTIDGKTQPYIKPIYFLQEGMHTLSYYSVDSVGNKEASKSISVYTVSVPPRSSARAIGQVVNTGGINYAKRDFELKLDATDNVVGVDRLEVKLDAEQEFKPYVDAIRFSTPGFHTVTYRAVDRAGNFEPARTYTVNISETPPETAIATAQPLIVREGVTYSPAPNVITFNVGNSPVGVAQTLVSINDANFKAYTGPLTLGADQKIYKISYKSVDKLGNEETPRSMTFHMIGTIPVVDLFISNGRSSEEAVRTNYLEQPGAKTAAQPSPARVPASAKGKAAKKDGGAESYPATE